MAGHVYPVVNATMAEHRLVDVTKHNTHTHTHTHTDTRAHPHSCQWQRCRNWKMRCEENTVRCCACRVTAFCPLALDDIFDSFVTTRRHKALLGCSVQRRMQWQVSRSAGTQPRLALISSTGTLISIFAVILQCPCSALQAPAGPGRRRGTRLGRQEQVLAGGRLSAN